MAFIGNTVQTQGFTPAIDYFNGNGVTVTFTLSRPIASVAQVIVAIDNVIQNPSSSFTVAGNAITFSSAPLSGTNNIWVEYTSLITTYQAISQDPTVIGDIRATGGYLAEGDFGNSFVDGVIVDYVTGLGRVTVGTAEGIALYNGGTANRTALASWNSSGTLTNTGGAVIQGLTVGKGFGALSQNTALGVSALSSASLTGNYNTAVGYQAAYSNTTGAQNTFIGRLAGYSNTADFGTAVGSLAMQSNTSGASNTALGSVSLNNNTTGSYNVAVGRDSLASNTTASNNTAVGYQAGYTTTVGNTTSVGYRAGHLSTTGGSWVAVGNESLYSNTTGSENTSIGSAALFANTTGSSNVAVGRTALFSNTTASNNTAVGYQSLYANTTGPGNTALGFGAGIAVTTGNSNTIVGREAGESLTTGSQSCFFGSYSGEQTTGSFNSFYGDNSGYLVTTGAKNTIIGRYNGNQGGLDIRTASNYIVLSDGDGTPQAYFQPSGNLVVTRTTFSSINAIGCYQDTSASAANVFITTGGSFVRSTSSRKYKTDIQDATHGLADVLNLRSVTYKGTGNHDNEQVLGGLIAEEVHDAGLTEFVQYAEDGTPDALAYGHMVSLCVKAIQELKAEFDAYKASHP